MSSFYSSSSWISDQGAGGVEVVDLALGEANPLRQRLPGVFAHPLWWRQRQHRARPERERQAGRQVWLCQAGAHERAENVPRVVRVDHLVRAMHALRWHTGGGQLRLNVFLRKLPRPGTDLLVDLVVVLEPSHHTGESRIGS